MLQEKLFWHCHLFEFGTRNFKSRIKSHRQTSFSKKESVWTICTLSRSMLASTKRKMAYREASLRRIGSLLRVMMSAQRWMLWVCNSAVKAGISQTCVSLGWRSSLSLSKMPQFCRSSMVRAANSKTASSASISPCPSQTSTQDQCPTSRLNWATTLSYPQMNLSSPACHYTTSWSLRTALTSWAPLNSRSILMAWESKVKFKWTSF